MSERDKRPFSSSGDEAEERRGAGYSNDDREQKKKKLDEAAEKPDKLGPGRKDTKNKHDDKGLFREPERKRSRGVESSSGNSRDTGGNRGDSERSSNRDRDRDRDRDRERERRKDRENDRRREVDDLDRRRGRSYERDHPREEERKKERRYSYEKNDSKRRHDDRSHRNWDRHKGRDDRHRRSSADDDDEPKGDRPAWATKAVMMRAEEIQKRKLIWSKHSDKDSEESSAQKGSGEESAGPRPSTTSTWTSILAATSSDSKQLDKFKRLMGMKKGDGAEADETPVVDAAQVEAEKQRQRNLYSQLDKQYAIARSTTHLGRGQGLGFHQ